jgi:hypothetical protein
MDWNYHTKMSFVKSFLRSAGYIALGLGSFVVAAIFLLIAEAFGIIEEF